MTNPYDWATESDRRLWLVTAATWLLYVLAFAIQAIGIILIVAGRPAGLILLAVAATVATFAWGLHRFEERL